MSVGIHKIHRDINEWFSISTPGGFIVRVEIDHLPEDLRKMVREALTADDDVEAVTFLSRLTGCRCTLHRMVQTTCEANTPRIPSPSMKGA